MEASTLKAPAVSARSGPSIGISLLRLRSDEQLVALFRAGNDDAFRTIHDRYRQRLFAYTRQMLAGRQDAEDALQDVFVRAYSGLRANDRQVALRAWLYRVAHNRCVDELRRPLVSPAEVFELISVPDQDPVAQADQRESLRRLIADVRRLPKQQRSALLMRELSGMSYAELAETLETTVPAVKSLLVRARMALALAVEARETTCTEIREALALAQDQRVRPGAMARRHLRDCPGCRDFRSEMRGTSRSLAALTPAVGPLAVAAKVLGFGFGGGAGGGAAMSGGTAVAGGSAAGGASAGVVGSGGMLASAGALVTSAGHVATLIVATVVTAGGAVGIQHTIARATSQHHHAHRAAPAATTRAQPPAATVMTAAESMVAAAAPQYASASVPAPTVLSPATSSGTPPPASTGKRPAPTAPAKSGRASKSTTPTSAPTSKPADGSSSTTPTTPGAPVTTPTSPTGTGSTRTAGGPTTPTVTNTTVATGGDGSTTSGTGATASTTTSGSPTTGSTTGSGAGADHSASATSAS